MYVKELDNVSELFEANCKLPGFIQNIIYFIKKVFCILTINSNICIIPYKKIKNNVIINVITKILLKTTKTVVLSKQLGKCDELNRCLKEKEIYVYKGDLLKKYLVYNFIEYIFKIRNEATYTKEIVILSNSPNEIEESNIIYFAEHFKRINIVTKNINRFKRLETYLEEKLGIAITVTNNKRKSLLKANMIINFDFNEEMLNEYNINSNAVFIQVNNKISIKSKLFNGVNVLDYQITYNNELNNFNKPVFRKFDNRLLYESTIFGKSYGDIIKQIQEDNVKIVNLIGKNGIINKQEF